MAGKPRIVLVTRPTPLELLVRQHGTLGQARFYLKTRGQKSDWYEGVHESFHAGFARVLESIPSDQRRVRVGREDLDRFLFGPDDVVLMVGQDGLVPNAAKYLSGQTAIGINPDPSSYDGVLCRHSPEKTAELLDWVASEDDTRYGIERRVMARVRREDGQTLLALNEVFVGHASHQSARYRLRVGVVEERHSSSGIICATGTGATGWARSIAAQRGIAGLPKPEDATLAWFVREPWPSVATGVDLNFGLIGQGQTLQLVSEMGDRGVVFADGIESDFIEFISGQTVEIGIADQRLNLVVPIDQQQAPEEQAVEEAAEQVQVRRGTPDRRAPR